MVGYICGFEILGCLKISPIPDQNNKLACLIAIQILYRTLKTNSSCDRDNLGWNLSEHIYLFQIITLFPRLKIIAQDHSIVYTQLKSLNLWLDKLKQGVINSPKICGKCSFPNLANCRTSQFMFPKCLYTKRGHYAYVLVKVKLHLHLLMNIFINMNRFKN